MTISAQFPTSRAAVNIGRSTTIQVDESMALSSQAAKPTNYQKLPSYAWKDDSYWQSEIDEWLESFGFTFNPFRALNAGEDSRLREYLVGHKAFESIRCDAVTLLFAPAGGGKSAFRVRLADACRVGENGRRLFPIVYLIPASALMAPVDKLWDAHEKAICQAAALELWIRFSFRPQEFLDLDPDLRSAVRFMLKAGLPGPLDHFLDALVTSGDPRASARLYDPTARWPKPPTVDELREFGRAIQSVAEISDLGLNPHMLDDWIDLLVCRLNFEGIYLLVDGIDAYPETLKPGQAAVDILRSLLTSAPSWSERRVFLKAFLPNEVLPLLRSEGLTFGVKAVTIAWSQEMLVSLIRRRVEAAMESAPASLDMLASPGLRDLDVRIAINARPLPREVMVLIEQLFLAHVQRAGPSGKLTEEDLQAALLMYQRQR